jgi:hypothetical protein
MASLTAGTCRNGVRYHPMELFVRIDRVQAVLLRDLLAAHGIRTHLLNTHVQGAVGELPPEAALPQVWLHDSSDRERADALLRRHDAERLRTGTLFCRHCSEESPATFESCWQCGTWL